MNVRLAIKPNNAAINGVCPICRGRTDPGTPYAIFLADSWDEVCDQCAQQHDPGLVLMVDRFDCIHSRSTESELRQEIKKQREHEAMEGCPF